MEIKKDSSSLPNNKVNLFALELEPSHCTVTLYFSPCLGADSESDHRNTPVLTVCRKGANIQVNCLAVEGTECLASILPGAGSPCSAPASAAAAANVAGKET